MSSVEMCEHDWPGTGCKECKRAALEAENAELRKECEAMAKNLRGKHATSGATYAHLIAERDTLRQQRDKLGAMNAKLRSKVSKLQQEVNSLKYLLSQGKDCCKCPYLLGKK